MALFTLLQKEDNANVHQSMGGWINACSTNLHNGTFGDKKTLATAQMNSENRLSERNQAQSDTYIMIPLI